ncbi:MAG: hypothetical protein NTX79_00055 [Candidatus Micrarchaeota archaeon]|nr:hypothetical protein [Candidatus Micrarchaeota archaeon]
MHKCSKCGRAATSLEEIDAGCPCGSKVFIFDRQIAQAAALEGDGGALGNGGNGIPAEGAAGMAGNAVGAGGNGNIAAPGAMAGANHNSAAGIVAGANGNPAEAAMGAASTFAVPGTSKERAQEAPGGQEGRVPESYFARTSFTNDDIENIKVLTQGVFLLDVNAISKSPVVLKDEDEIYYVKLPLVQKKAPEAAQGKEGNGKK